MKKTPLQQAVAKVAPCICISTLWEYDPFSGPISKECDGFTQADDDKWTAWQSEIRATAIIDGEEVTGTAHLGGSFERAGDDPAESNPTISGYELQMTLEALEDLLSQAPSLSSEIHQAIKTVESTIQ